MEQLVFSDTKKLHQSIQKLYALRNPDTFGMDALSILNQLVPSDMPAFHSVNIQAHHISIDYALLVETPSFTPEMERVMLQGYGGHPMVQNMPLTLNGAYKTSDFLTQQELHRTEALYQQFLQPLGMEDQMCFFLPNETSRSWRQLLRTDATLTGVVFNRSERSFTERDRLILNLLRPHLYQAYCNAQHYQQLQQELSQLQQSINHLDLIILNAEGQIQSIAPQAILWLESYFAKPTCSHQLPDHLWSWIKYQIAGLTKNLGIPKACLPLRIQQVGKELVIRLVVEQLGARYLLLLEEQILSPMSSLALLGLSHRETEVLSWVMQGKDNKAIAAQLSINISTVRKHLESIYRKFGVHSRTEAIAQTLAKLGLLQI
jgi:DNA-binding CsgD family transcriptional regulator